MSHSAIAMVCMGLLALSACSSKPSTTPTSSKSRAPLENLVEDANDRAVVAKVNGVSVYADCVQRQAQAHHLSRAEALDECINFELLSQAANQPEYLLAPEVQQPASQELVRAFVEASFSADIPDKMVEALWRQNTRRYNRPELRDIVFCRIALPEGATADSAESKKASAFLMGLYNELKTRKELTKVDLFTACYGEPDAPDTEPRPFQLAGIEKVELNYFRPTPRAGYTADFHKTVFDGPQVAGMVTPPLLTRHGWDLILIKEILPAISTEFAKAEPELRKALTEEPVYEAQRAAIFYEWYAPLEAKHIVKRSFERLPEHASLLDSQLGTAPAPAPSAPPESAP